ncbi:MAG: hypothetical protein M1836_007061 [Candelina mexicana]|nr:MAG: hypothetical protein M1836_007061 [Candelina mexicana]
MSASPRSSPAAGAGANSMKCVVSPSLADESLRKRKRDEASSSPRQPENDTTSSATSSNRAGRTIRCGLPSSAIEEERAFDLMYWYGEVVKQASEQASNRADEEKLRVKRPKSEPKATKPKREAKKGRKARLRGPDGRFVKRVTIKSEAHEDKAGEAKPSSIVRS